MIDPYPVVDVSVPGGDRFSAVVTREEAAQLVALVQGWRDADPVAPFEAKRSLPDSDSGAA